MDAWDDHLLSDDDEEIVQYLESGHFSRKVYDRSDVLNNFEDDDFLNRFRISKKSTEVLYKKIILHFHREFNKKQNAVSPMNMLLCTLRYFATGSLLTSCRDVIGAHESTACRILHRMTHAITSLYDEFIKMPATVSEQRDAAAKFYKIAKFPRVIGAVHSTHIKIVSPGTTKDMYKNRFGYYSINTQCICTADLLLQDVVAHYHGSAYNIDVWENCSQNTNFKQGDYGDKLLVGDISYAHAEHIMTPFPKNAVATKAEQLYQESQIKTRRVGEKAIEFWKRRFPILAKGTSVRLARVPGLIMAIAVVHNIAVRNRDPLPPKEEDVPDLEDYSAALPASTSRSSTSHVERNKIINTHFANL